MSKKVLKAITPTYQSLLVKQLGRVTEAMDADDPLDAFIKLRTLIMLLNPDHRKDLLNNEVHSIQQEIDKILGLKGTDLVQTRNLQRSRLRAMLSTVVLDLFLKVMALLHLHGYLEIRGPKYPVSYEKNLRRLSKASG